MIYSELALALLSTPMITGNHRRRQLYGTPTIGGKGRKEDRHTKQARKMAKASRKKNRGRK